VSSLQRFLRKAPNAIQRVVYGAVPFGLRYGKHFLRYRREALQRQEWTVEALREYQSDRLIETLLAAQCTEWWRGVFKKNAIGFDDICNTPHLVLSMMPVMTKEDIRANGEKMRVPGFRKKDLTTLTTSGTTGTALSIAVTKDACEQEAAFQERAFVAHGPSLFWNRSVWLKRYCPTPGDPLWQWDAEKQRLMLSPYHISEWTVREYVERINESRAPILVGYPSSVYILAVEARAKGLTLPYVKSIHTSSEVMLRQWAETIKAVFNVMPRDHYGMMERGAFFYRCPQSENYHEAIDYGCTESHRDGIVVTGFINHAQPVVRYLVEDVVEWLPVKERCPCGSGLPLTVKSFHGRSGDILIARDGHMVPSVQFYTVMGKIAGLRLFQIVQEEAGQATVKAVIHGNEAQTKEALRNIGIAVSTRLGVGSKVESLAVDDIPREANGKYRAVVNRRKW